MNEDEEMSCVGAEIKRETSNSTCHFILPDYFCWPTNISHVECEDGQEPLNCHKTECVLKIQDIYYNEAYRLENKVSKLSFS